MYQPAVLTISSSVVLDCVQAFAIIGYRIDFDQECGGTKFGAGFRVEDVRLAKGQVFYLDTAGFLWSKEPRSVARW